MMQTYEIRRRFIGQVIEHLSWKDGFGNKHDKEIKMFHIEASDPKKAEEKSRKYGGNFVSCRKANRERIIGLENVEHIHIEPPPPEIYGKGNPYVTPMAMDSMIWNKRNKRRSNLYKDKEDSIDK